MENNYKTKCGVLRSRISQMYELVNDDTLSIDDKLKIVTAELENIINDVEYSYDALECYDDYSYYISHSDIYENYMEEKKRSNSK